ncbi:hypothetical protein Goari_019389 [Gossypium aridum]|uniref:Uncharacterized protein n=1 Tax=Gossypium aridum TaxID=34290 RepID=A0A7J8WSZ2_GOSAI|nr:hypothetical protein [Gossypium aridum]
MRYRVHFPLFFFMIVKDNSKMRINCLELVKLPKSSRTLILLRKTLSCI